MSSATARQRYLYLVARLYDLAAEFSDIELEKMEAAYRQGDSTAVLEAIALLKRFHGSKGARGIFDERRAIEATMRSERERASNRKEAWNDRALIALLEDKELFPNVSDIAAVFPDEFAVRPKEARDRYVRRVMRYVTSLSDAEKSEFQAKLKSLVSRTPGGFVSQWKNLIQAL
jgi:hypothetical protein